MGALNILVLIGFVFPNFFLDPDLEFPCLFAAQILFLVIAIKLQQASF
jgi:hypothetical protein